MQRQTSVLDCPSQDNRWSFLQQAECIKGLRRLHQPRGFNELRGKQSSKLRLLLVSGGRYLMFLDGCFITFFGLMLWTLPWSCGSFPNEPDETKWGAHYGGAQINDSVSNIWRKLCNVRRSFLSSQHEPCCRAAGVYLNSLISDENVGCTSKKR